jgi:hypothetical protein
MSLPLRLLTDISSYLSHLSKSHLSRPSTYGSKAAFLRPDFNMEKQGLTGRCRTRRSSLALTSTTMGVHPMYPRTEHAFFSTNTDSGLPEVLITDKASMHDTIVNRQRLEANSPKRLSPGDEI